MNTLIQKFSDVINGYISGFDRIVFKARYDKTAGFPRLSRHWGKCKHLYFYYDHEDYGFMNIRLQTWFPYHIQIAMNGREWLRRSLEKLGRLTTAL
jgi:hypothetical protein